MVGSGPHKNRTIADMFSAELTCLTHGVQAFPGNDGPKASYFDCSRE